MSTQVLPRTCEIKDELAELLECVRVKVVAALAANYSAEAEPAFSATSRLPLCSTALNAPPLAHEHSRP